MEKGEKWQGGRSAAGPKGVSTPILLLGNCTCSPVLTIHLTHLPPFSAKAKLSSISKGKHISLDKIEYPVLDSYILCNVYVLLLKVKASPASALWPMFMR
jgi:hypothetical protein